MMSVFYNPLLHDNSHKHNDTDIIAYQSSPVHYIVYLFGRRMYINDGFDLFIFKFDMQIFIKLSEE